MPDGAAPRPDPNVVDVELGPAGLQPCLGRIVGVDAGGRPLVRFVGLKGAPPVARLIGVVPREQIDAAVRDARPILIGFLEGRADAPVIMSLASMADLGAPEPDRELETLELARADAMQIEVDGSPGERVIEATEQLVLRCGDAAITLRADGTVRIIGRDITSWARRRQRIRGASVGIN